MSKQSKQDIKDIGADTTSKAPRLGNVSTAFAYELWLQDDSPAISFGECLICKEEGYPNQRGHSTQSCLADRIRQDE